MNNLFGIENYKLLTLWQPWASLLVHKIKLLETRPKPTSWTVEKGTYLIHASSKWSKEQAKLCLKEPFLSALTDIADEIGSEYDVNTGKSEFICKLPLGKIIGSIEVTECRPIYSNLSGDAWIYEMFNYRIRKTFIETKEKAYGNYETGSSAWLTQNPRILKTPIPYKGGQGYYQNFKGDTNQLKFI